MSDRPRVTCIAAMFGPLLLAGCIIGISGMPGGVVKLVAPDRKPYDDYGLAVAISDDLAIVGAERKAVPDAGGKAGAAFVYRKIGSHAWDSGTALVAPDAEDGDGFGCSVAIDGDCAVAGAEGRDSAGPGAGAAYIFRRTGPNAWDKGVRLVAPDGESRDSFGNEVAISGDSAVVCARFRGSGAVYLFRRTGTNEWDSGSRIDPPDPDGVRIFGQSVAMSGNRFVVSAEKQGTMDEGIAYVFLIAADGSCTLESELSAPASGLAKRFGLSSVTIDGNTVIVGASSDVSGGVQTGAAYVFRRAGTGSWSPETRLAAPGTPFGEFGLSVAINGDIAAISDIFDDEKGEGSGAVHVFRRTGEHSWDGGTKIVAPDGGKDAEFGVKVAIDGSNLIIGAYLQDGDRGAAYIFPVR
ncbi:MAG: FG-GAP repeat protein [Spirochaetes bacterium]|nr:FG-GAP repeat protein [Spirochaetota bacterium]